MSAKSSNPPYGGSNPVLHGGPVLRSRTNSNGSKSEAKAELLQELLKESVDLCQGGRLTTKNAFAISLLDRLAEVLRRHAGLPESDLATGAYLLEAASKIYGYRVDSVMQLLVRVLNHLWDLRQETGNLDGTTPLRSEDHIDRTESTLFAKDAWFGQSAERHDPLEGCLDSAHFDRHLLIRLQTDSECRPMLLKRQRRERCCEVEEGVEQGGGAVAGGGSGGHSVIIERQVRTWLTKYADTMETKDPAILPFLKEYRRSCGIGGDGQGLSVAKKMNNDRQNAGEDVDEDVDVAAGAGFVNLHDVMQDRDKLERLQGVNDGDSTSMQSQFVQKRNRKTSRSCSLWDSGTKTSNGEDGLVARQGEKGFHLTTRDQHDEVDLLMSNIEDSSHGLPFSSKKAKPLRTSMLGENSTDHVDDVFVGQGDLLEGVEKPQQQQTSHNKDEFLFTPPATPPPRPCKDFSPELHYTRIFAAADDADEVKTKRRFSFSEQEMDLYEQERSSSSFGGVLGGSNLFGDDENCSSNTSKQLPTTLNGLKNLFPGENWCDPTAGRVVVENEDHDLGLGILSSTSGGGGLQFLADLLPTAAKIDHEGGVGGCDAMNHDIMDCAVAADLEDVQQELPAQHVVGFATPPGSPSKQCLVPGTATDFASTRLPSTGGFAVLSAGGPSPDYDPRSSLLREVEGIRLDTKDFENADLEDVLDPLSGTKADHNENAVPGVNTTSPRLSDMLLGNAKTEDKNDNAVDVEAPIDIEEPFIPMDVVDDGFDHNEFTFGDMGGDLVKDGSGEKDVVIEKVTTPLATPVKPKKMKKKARGAARKGSSKVKMLDDDDDEDAPGGTNDDAEPAVLEDDVEPAVLEDGVDDPNAPNMLLLEDGTQRPVTGEMVKDFYQMMLDDMFADQTSEDSGAPLLSLGLGGPAKKMMKMKATGLLKNTSYGDNHGVDGGADADAVLHSQHGAGDKSPLVLVGDADPFSLFGSDGDKKHGGKNLLQDQEDQDDFEFDGGLDLGVGDCLGDGDPPPFEPDNDVDMMLGHEEDGLPGGRVDSVLGKESMDADELGGGGDGDDSGHNAKTPSSWTNNKRTSTSINALAVAAPQDEMKVGPKHVEENEKRREERQQIEFCEEGGLALSQQAEVSMEEVRSRVARALDAAFAEVDYKQTKDHGGGIGEASGDDKKKAKAARGETKKAATPSPSEETPAYPSVRFGEVYQKVLALGASESGTLSVAMTFLGLLMLVTGTGALILQNEDTRQKDELEATEATKNQTTTTTTTTANTTTTSTLTNGKKNDVVIYQQVPGSVADMLKEVAIEKWG
ncbi:unnamed protein product [Amoebophrya sp. A25]|nr:unnamed protein product [Amoebophrya sp. A25]|eukprot:GSA25T00014863001.1